MKGSRGSGDMQQTVGMDEEGGGTEYTEEEEEEEEGEVDLTGEMNESEEENKVVGEAIYAVEEEVEGGEDEEVGEEDEEVKEESDGGEEEMEREWEGDEEEEQGEEGEREVKELSYPARIRGIQGNASDDSEDLDVQEEPSSGGGYDSEEEYGEVEVDGTEAAAMSVPVKKRDSRRFASPPVALQQFKHGRQKQRTPKSHDGSFPRRKSEPRVARRGGESVSAHVRQKGQKTVKAASKGAPTRKILHSMLGDLEGSLAKHGLQA